MPQKSPPKVGGPWKAPDGSGRYRLRVDGSDRFFASKEDAQAEKDRLKPPAEGVEIPDEHEVGSSRWWAGGLAAIASAAAAAPGDGDLRSLARCWAACAQASHHIADLTELEENLAAINKWRAEMMTAVRLGTQRSDAAPGEVPAAGKLVDEQPGNGRAN